MKKKFLTVLFALLLAGCNNATASKSYPSWVSSSDWGVERAGKMFDTFEVLIPYMEADSHELVYSIDDYGDDFLSAYFYYSSDEIAASKVSEYTDLCASKGYACEVSQESYIDYDTMTSYQYEVVYASKVIHDSLGFEMQFLSSIRDGKACLGVFAYNYVYCPKDAWPTAAVTHLIGDKAAYVPAINNSDYTYNFVYDVSGDKSTIILEIQITGCDYTIEEDYFYEMKEIGYTQLQLDTLDDEYSKKVEDYPEFADQYNFLTFMEEKIAITYDYVLNSNMFIIDIWVTK